MKSSPSPQAGPSRRGQADRAGLGQEHRGDPADLDMLVVADLAGGAQAPHAVEERNDVCAAQCGRRGAVVVALQAQAVGQVAEIDDPAPGDTGYCESDGHSFAVVFTQHKGGMYVEMVAPIPHEVDGDPAAHAPF